MLCIDDDAADEDAKHTYLVGSREQYAEFKTLRARGCGFMEEVLKRSVEANPKVRPRGCAALPLLSPCPLLLTPSSALLGSPLVPPPPAFTDAPQDARLGQVVQLGHG